MLNKFSLISIFLMLIPVVTYGFIIVYFSVNIPDMDDYDVVLGHINISDDSLRYKNFFSQHNEHRIAWTRFIIECYYFFFGKINFEYLIYIGNLGLLLFFLLVLKISKEQKILIILLIPISYLLFQLQAWENMTWATGSLQNYYILFFALLTLYFWNKKTLYGYFLSWIFGVIAIYTSANGLLIFLVLVIFQLTEFFEKFKKCVTSQQKNLILRRQSLLLCILLVLSFFMFYFYFKSYQKVGHPSIIEALLQPLILTKYAGTLIGSYMGMIFAFWVGLLEVFVFLFLTYKRYDQKNPVVYYFMLFIFLSIFATALGRSGFGVEQALASRYKTLSVVLLALIYLAFLEIYPKQFSKKLVICCLIFLAMVFNLGSTTMSIHNIVSRKNTLIEGITTWKNTRQGLAYPDQKRASFLLNQSIEKGIYYPPN
jgi:hypothetical protein